MGSSIFVAKGGICVDLLFWLVLGLESHFVGSTFSSSSCQVFKRGNHPEFQGLRKEEEEEEEAYFGILDLERTDPDFRAF